MKTKNLTSVMGVISPVLFASIFSVQAQAKSPIYLERVMNADQETVSRSLGMDDSKTITPEKAASADQSNQLAEVSEPMKTTSEIGDDLLKDSIVVDTEILSKGLPPEREVELDNKNEPVDEALLNLDGKIAAAQLNERERANALVQDTEIKAKGLPAKTAEISDAELDQMISEAQKLIVNSEKVSSTTQDTELLAKGISKNGEPVSSDQDVSVQVLQFDGESLVVESEVEQKEIPAEPVATSEDKTASVDPGTIAVEVKEIDQQESTGDYLEQEIAALKTEITSAQEEADAQMTKETQIEKLAVLKAKEEQLVLLKSKIAVIDDPVEREALEAEITAAEQKIELSKFKIQNNIQKIGGAQRVVAEVSKADKALSQELEEKLDEKDKYVDKLLSDAKEKNVLDLQLDRLGILKDIKANLSELNMQLSNIESEEEKARLLAKLEKIQEKLLGAKEDIKTEIAKIGGEDSEEEDKKKKEKKEESELVAKLQKELKKKNKAYCSLHSEMSDLKSTITDLQTNLASDMAQNFATAMMPMFMNYVAQSSGQLNPGVVNSFPNNNLGLNYTSLTDLFKAGTLSPVTNNYYFNGNGMPAGMTRNPSWFDYTPLESRIWGTDPNNRFNAFNPMPSYRPMDDPMEFLHRPFSFGFTNGVSDNNRYNFGQMNSQYSAEFNNQIHRSMSGSPVIGNGPIRFNGPR